MIGIHFSAVNFLRPMNIYGKRKHLSRWQQEIIVVFKKLIGRLINRRSVRRSSIHVHGAELETALNFPLRFGLQVLTLRRIIVKMTKAPRG